MSWEVEYTDQFGDWWKTLNDKERDRIAMLVKLLEARGPNLGFPYSSSIKSSRHGNMKNLRKKHKGDHILIIYAFDPRRNAILLIEVINGVMIDGMTKQSLSLMIYMTNI